MKQHYHSAIDLSQRLFEPRLLLRLFLGWLIIVLLGSGITILVTQSSFLSDAEVEAILSENEQLALSANVAFTESQAQQPTESGPPVFPQQLIVPSLGVQLPVSNPTTRNIELLDEELKSAVVRYPDSATLGSDGNVLVFGHSSQLPIVRNKFFKAFNNIQKLDDGEEILARANGDTYHYRVTRVYQASATDDRIPLTVPNHRLTLLTCDSFGSRSDRWVVEAEYVGKNLAT